MNLFKICKIQYSTNIPKEKLIGISIKQYAKYLELKKNSIKLDRLIENIKQDMKYIKKSVSYHENARRNSSVDSFYYKSHQTNIHKLNAKREYIESILKILEE